MPSVNSKISLAAAVVALLAPHVQGLTMPPSLFPRAENLFPPALPSCATPGDLKWQPAMDFDTDGCLSSAAIGTDGSINPGLDHCHTQAGRDCRELRELENNNVYVRARCNSDWCAHIYGYYFKKDVGLDNSCVAFTGHRHDWEHVVVWVYKDVAKYVAVSGHGGYTIEAVENIRMDGTHPKIVYHKDGGSTHAMRFANENDDNIENPMGKWFYGALVSWNGFPTMELRDQLGGHNWGSASFELTDEKIGYALYNAQGEGVVIEMDPFTETPEIAPGIPENECSPLWRPT